MRWPSLGRTSRRERREAILEHLRKPQIFLEGELVRGAKSAVRASLVGADLEGCDLRAADLREVDLRDSNLRGARFDGADLSWADLSGADLTGARFGTARLVETVLHGAELTDCDLSRVTGLTSAAVRGHHAQGRVRWPSGFDPVEPRAAGPLTHRSARS